MTSGGHGRYAGAFALAVVMVAVLIRVELLEGRIASCSQGVHTRDDD